MQEEEEPLGVCVSIIFTKESIMKHLTKTMFIGLDPESRESHTNFQNTYFIPDIIKSRQDITLICPISATEDEHHYLETLRSEAETCIEVLKEYEENGHISSKSPLRTAMEYFLIAIDRDGLYNPRVRLKEKKDF